MNSITTRYKNITVTPNNWQILRNEQLCQIPFCVQFIYIDDHGVEHLISISPLESLDIEVKKKEILNIIQILPLKLNSGFNPLDENYYDYTGLFIDYSLQITPATGNYNNGSVLIKLNYVNPSEFIFRLNNNYSNNPNFTKLENGLHQLEIIHIISNQKIIIPFNIIPTPPNYFAPFSNVIDSFRNAFPFTNGNDDYKKDFGQMMDRIYDVIVNLNLHHKKISEIKKNDIKVILDGLNVPAHVYNKTRSYLSLIYNVLIDFEVVDQNIIKTVPKAKTITRIRKIIPDEVLDQILKHLHDDFYSFYRYVKIFYHSGSRTTELYTLKAKDVNLEKREFKIVINKGKSPTEEIKAILPDVYPLWKEIIEECDNNSYYLFSHSYLPGKEKMNPKTNAANWTYHVQKKLNLQYTFYSLKHKFLDILDEYQNLIVFNNNNIASIHAGHTTTKMTERHYLMGKKKRQIEALKQFSLENITSLD